jgi:hypothetical protein
LLYFIYGERIQATHTSSFKRSSLGFLILNQEKESVKLVGVFCTGKI